jgi:hypothetical protein
MLGLIQRKIQKGRSGSATVTITAVSDINKCEVFCTANGSAYLSGVTSLVVTVFATYGQATVDWQVVEHGGAI